MKKHVKVLAFVLMALLVFVAGCGNNVVESGKKVLDSGSINNGIYTNDFFGISISIPTNWHVASEEELIQMIEEGNEMVAGDDEDLQKLIQESNLRTVFLLSTTSNDPLSNASFMVMAEKLSFLQGVRTGKDYLEILQQNLEELVAQIPYEFPKEIYTEKIGNQTFHVLETTVDLVVAEFKQTYYTAVLNGYALAFISTTMDESEEDLLEGMISQISFK